MTTVRFSQDLKSKIRRNAEKLFESQHKNDVEFPEAEALAIYDEYISSLNFTQEQEPFLARSQYVRISLNDSEYKTHTMKTESKRPKPQNTLETEHFKINHWGDTHIVLFDTERTYDVVEQIKKYYFHGKELERERKEFVRSVMKITDTFSTLAPALKEWPPLWHLLPEETQERHKQVNKRKTKKAELDKDELDMDKLTSTVVASRLKGD